MQKREDLKLILFVFFLWKHSPVLYFVSIAGFIIHICVIYEVQSI